MPYKKFLIFAPDGAKTYEPDKPLDNLLDAVVACGAFPLEVGLCYFEESAPWQPIAVPADVREQARAHWDAVLNPLTEEKAATDGE